MVTRRLCCLRFLNTQLDGQPGTDSAHRLSSPTQFTVDTCLQTIVPLLGLQFLKDQLDGHLKNGRTPMQLSMHYGW